MYGALCEWLPENAHLAQAALVRPAGVPERVVMEILGHSTLAMVKRYQHVLPGLTVCRH